jgi:hypothetical protein
MKTVRVLELLDEVRVLTSEMIDGPAASDAPKRNRGPLHAPN